MKKKITIAIIGCGNIGSKRLVALKNNKQASIKFIVGTKNKKQNLEALQNSVKYNIPFLNDFKKLVNSGKKLVDAAIVATPPSAVFKISSFLIKNRIDLLVEKPLGISLSESKKITNLSIKNKTVLKTGFNLRFDKGIKELKRFIELKKLGKIYYFKIQYSNGAVKTNKNNIGGLLDIGSHSFNLICYIFKGLKIKKLKFIQSSHEYHKNDNGFVIFDYNKINFFVHYSFVVWKNKFCIEVGGSKGTIKLNSLPKWGNQTLAYLKRNFPSGKPVIKYKKKFKRDYSWKNECNHFINLCKNRNIQFNIEGLENYKILTKIN